MSFVSDCLTLYSDTLALMWSNPVLRYLLTTLLFVAVSALVLYLLRAAHPDSR